MQDYLHDLAIVQTFATLNREIMVSEIIKGMKWNSAPHGAGRIMKREDVKANFTVSTFKREMKGIYSSCISKDTLDKAPFVYRNIESIQEIITQTVTIDKVIQPVYNYKAGGN